MTDERLNLPQATLDLLILKALSLESHHGWASSERRRLTDAVSLVLEMG